MRKIIFVLLILFAVSVSTSAQNPLPDWTAGAVYTVNFRANYNNVVYKCLQAHTAQIGWEPPNAPSLWQTESGGTTGGGIFTDDFETARGWTVNPNNTDTATAGAWERGSPERASFKGLKQTGTPHGGANLLVTGRTAGSDVNGGLTSIRSPAIVLPAGMNGLQTSFWYYFAHDSRATNADFFRVKVIGSTTETVFQINGRARNQNAAWQKQSISLDAFAGQTVRLQFETMDGANDSIIEAAIDDVDLRQTAVAGLPFPSRVFAPYVDVLLYPAFPLAATAAQTGSKYYTLAFITNSNAGGCAATWGGAVALSENFLLTDLNNLRTAGGNVIVSFGGANGVELATACTTVDALKTQYRAVIDAYNLTQIDLDIEGVTVLDTATNDRRNKALAALQREYALEGKTLKVSFTLAVLPTGLELSGRNLLQNAVANNVNVSAVNIMAMDYGAIANPNTMGQNAIDAANATLAQLQPIFTGRTPAQLKQMLGVTPMIGLNDVVPEVFTMNDAQLLLNYAHTNNIGRIAMWSMTRDKQCSGAPTVSPVCSGITQQTFDFTNRFKVFSQ